MTDGSRDAGARGVLVDEARRFYERGWMPATAGNLSVRIGGASLRLLITASGVDKGAMQPDDIVEVDGSWHERLWAGRRPSAETWIHTAVYEAVPWAGAVFHVHTVATTVLGQLAPGPHEAPSAIEVSGLEMVKALGLWDDGAILRLPVFPNWSEVPRIGEDIRRVVASDAPPALLVRGHGLTAWGRDAREARKHVEAADFLCASLLELRRHRD